MTVKDHEKNKREALKLARASADERNWLAASNYYRMAAHHAAVIQAAKSV